MCISPIKIKNANVRNGKIYRSPLRVGSPMALKDCTCQYIEVPCGHCCECIQKRQNDIVQRVQMESLNSYLYFCTLTYDNEHIPNLVTSKGEIFTYASVDDLQKCLKRVRKYFPVPFRFLACSERGSKRLRPHWHVLIFVPKKDTDIPQTPFIYESLLFTFFRKYWAINVGTRKMPIYETLYKYKRSIYNGKLSATFDLHFVRPREDDVCSNVAFYVSKYMVKYNDNNLRIKLKNQYSPEESHKIMEIIKCRTIRSVAFGSKIYTGKLGERINESNDISAYIRSCIDKSKANKLEFPTFFYVDSNHNYPLSSYLRKKFMTMDDALHWYFNKQETDIDTIIYHCDKKFDINKINKKIEKHDNIHSLINCPSVLDFQVDSKVARYVTTYRKYKLLREPTRVTLYKTKLLTNVKNFDYDNETQIYSPSLVLGCLFPTR